MCKTNRLKEGSFYICSEVKKDQNVMQQQEQQAFIKEN